MAEKKDLEVLCNELTFIVHTSELIEQGKLPPLRPYQEEIFRLAEMGGKSDFMKQYALMNGLRERTLVLEIGAGEPIMKPGDLLKSGDYDFIVIDECHYANDFEKVYREPLPPKTGMHSSINQNYDYMRHNKTRKGKP